MLTTNTPSITEGSPIAPTTANNTSEATSASDFQSFLRLLTAQLRNQDPLSPLDSTQFVEQLASFSAVEQQIETNNHLEALAGNFATSGLDGAVQWIGKEVEVSSGDAYFQGEALTFKIPPDTSDRRAELIITDRNGTIVRRDELARGLDRYVWSGETGEGVTAKEGAYKVELTYYDRDTLSETRTPIAVTEVTEARLIDGSVRLALGNGALVDPEQISVVRNSTSAKESNTQS